MARSTSSPVAASGTSVARGAGRARSPSTCSVSLRPGQWTKNLLVFAGLLFGRRLFDPAAVVDAARGVRDLLRAVGRRLPGQRRRRSRERSAAPAQARRPIASGALPVPTALGAAAVARRGGARRRRSRSGRRSRVVAAAYLALQLLYSGPLKHIVIIDVLTIAIGFVLRAVAGAVAIDVEISHWLLVCTILLALFIALAKRRHELVLLADGATEPSADPRRVQPVSARSDDRRRHGVDADRVHLLHDQPGDASRSSGRRGWA